jgi:hypothetical protein
MLRLWLQFRNRNFNSDTGILFLVPDFDINVYSKFQSILHQNKSKFLFRFLIGIVKLKFLLLPIISTNHFVESLSKF